MATNESDTNEKDEKGTVNIGDEDETETTANKDPSSFAPNKERRFFFNLSKERQPAGKRRKNDGDKTNGANTDNNRREEKDYEEESENGRQKKKKKATKSSTYGTARHVDFVSAMQKFTRTGGKFNQVVQAEGVQRPISEQPKNEIRPSFQRGGGMICSKVVGRNEDQAAPSGENYNFGQFRSPTGPLLTPNQRSSEPEVPEKLKMFDEKLIKLIQNEIIVQDVITGWEDIAGLEQAKKALKEIIVWPFLRPEIFQGIRAPPKGVLLFGPPGTGKTMIGRCVASQCKATFFNISASSLTSKWVGEGEKLVRALFAVARTRLPAVIFIDEVDSLLASRSDSEHESSRRIKTEFLVQLDGVSTSNDERLLVLGATNRPQELDEAARRRFGKRLYIGLPEIESRIQMVSHWMKSQQHSLVEQQQQQIAEKTEGYSGADMRSLCVEAAYGPLRTLQESIETVQPDQIRPISFDDFVSALSVVRPTVVEKDMEVYDIWNKQFGCLSLG